MFQTIIRPKTFLYLNGPTHHTDQHTPPTTEPTRANTNTFEKLRIYLRQYFLWFRPVRWRGGPSGLGSVGFLEFGAYLTS